MTLSKPGSKPFKKDLAEIKKLLQNQRPQPSRPAPFKPQDVSIKGAPFLGEADAKLTLVEFTDYQCSFCKRHFTAVLPQIKKDYVDTGKVKYVFEAVSSGEYSSSRHEGLRGRALCR